MKNLLKQLLSFITRVAKSQIFRRTFSLCYALADFLHKIISPLVGNTNSFVKNSEHFIKSIQDINLQNEDCLASFDVIRLFSNVPMGEVLQIIRNRLNRDSSFSERSPLHVDDVMEFFFNLVGWDLIPLGPFAGPLGSYKSQYCGHTLAYCTFSPDDI
jgi:hypothetical protein